MRIALGAQSSSIIALVLRQALVVIGVGLGIVAAAFRDRWLDHLIRVVSLGGVSMPVFWIALVAFYLLFFRLGWLPGGGRLDPAQVAPTHLTGLYTVDALVHGQWTLLWSALRHLVDTVVEGSTVKVVGALLGGEGARLSEAELERIAGLVAKAKKEGSR